MRHTAGVRVSVSVTTAMASNLRSPSLMALKSGYALGANGKAVGGIFHVAAAVDFT